METIKRLEGIRGPVNANVRTLADILAALDHFGVFFERVDRQVVVRMRGRAAGGPHTAAGAAPRVPGDPSDPMFADQGAPSCQTMLRNIPGMLGYWDRDLRCRFSNQAYKEWFGKTPDQMRGIAAWELLGSELFELNKPYFLAALGGTPQAFERIIVKPSGQPGRTWAQYVPDRDENGLVKGVCAIVTDISALKVAPPRV
ncbi:MAG: PAS domain-containing protein [Proteobacteria bacterium]|nr:PAS domain-containing protein [Pseudomonadota bacterium]